MPRSTRAPSYKGYKPATSSASRALSRVKAAGTGCEDRLRKALWKLKLRYRKNYARLPGCPDIAFPAARVAVFCDGDFWHGKDWGQRKRRLRKGTNSTYWIAKIGSNIARDQRINRELRELGWIAIRVWESDIRADANGVANRIARTVRLRASG